MYSTIFQLGPIIIRSYALMLAIAFSVSTFIAVRRAKRYGIPSHEIINLASVIIFASLLGSRVLFVFEHGETFVKNPSAIFYVWQGGSSYYGGLIFAFIGLIIWVKMKSIEVGRMLDIFAPSAALGFFFVRIGCFLNGCCFGKPTSMPWGVIFPPDSPAGSVYTNMTIHPTQIYSAVSGLLGFGLLLYLEEKWHMVKKKPGLLFLSFLILSSLWRFIIEYFRYHEAHSTIVGWFTEAQAYSAVVFILSIIMIVKTSKKKPPS